jgi:hypothetical protein
MTAVALCCEYEQSIELYRDAVFDCGWSRASIQRLAGGNFALCPEWTVPFASGVFVSEAQPNLHVAPLVVLAPALTGIQIDGFMDGEWLTDSHAHIHGEPPGDGVPLGQLVTSPLARGTGKHREKPSGPVPTPVPVDDVLSLCCGAPARSSVSAPIVLPPSNSLPAVPFSSAPIPGRSPFLHSCEYRRALVPADADSSAAGGYAAKLACRDGQHVVSGGCYAQFTHSGDNALLAGSHPYEGGASSDLPETGDAPGDLTGENGWACRLDRAPASFANGIAKLAVEAICCE